MNLDDEKYMRQAIALSLKGTGRVNPNPLVGAVVVKDGRIIGEGYHQQYGCPHAERNALAACTESPAGATIYVTLEPCCHHGKNPPCTEALIQAGISHVVVGSADPNPLVAGKGIAQLKAAGIQVEEGFLQAECDAINFIFFHYITTNKPYLALKYAMTADGKIACHTGASRWITGEVARHHVHQLRNKYAAIMVGTGTVLADDPELTCRIENGNNPVRIVCDTQLRTPLSSKLVTTAKEVPTIIATCCQEEARYKLYQEAGCQIWVVPAKNGGVDLQALVHRLGQEKIDSVLVEGGGQLNWSLLQAGLVQRVYTYIAPKIFGGAAAKSPVGGIGVDNPQQAFQMRVVATQQLGEDFLLEQEVLPSCHSADCSCNEL
ncbi:MAG: bifunctional diaminohydroxyphosphoribosylaminopyrimidine deaminase/5-amino-6-(5-phosphoribosylamino)uracil reductase RibD [Treponema sp.]|nr:bifunctional diaminohydroxyphosphoribosylaminopyrimidine deaminase/5-amino-6-(5-phosphoribosylamino)uracil reductase RibD [Treponema sp.]